MAGQFRQTGTVIQRKGLDKRGLDIGHAIKEKDEKKGQIEKTVKYRVFMSDTTGEKDRKREQTGPDR
jgi:hypothetical protein